MDPPMGRHRLGPVVQLQVRSLDGRLGAELHAGPTGEDEQCNQPNQMTKNDTCDVIAGTPGAGAPEEMNFELLLPVSRDLADRFPIRAARCTRCWGREGLYDLDERPDQAVRTR